MWFHPRWRPRIVDWFGIHFAPWLCLYIVDVIVEWALVFSLQPRWRFQELETVPLCSNLSISGRNMHQIWTDGKSVVQLGIAPPSGSRLPNSPWANRALGACRKEASTDRSSFEANTDLTFKEAASSIDDWRSNRHVKRKKSLTTGGHMEVFAQPPSIPNSSASSPFRLFFMKLPENERYPKEI